MKFPSLPVLDVGKALDRLPAEARANVVWARKPIDDGLARLRTEALTDELIATVAEDVWHPIASVAGSFWGVVGGNFDEWRARLNDDFQEEERQLVDFIREDEARDTLSWVLGLCRACLTLSLSLPPELLAQVPPEVFARVGRDEDFKPYIRGLVALMGAVDVRRVGGDPQRARDLIDISFLELTKFRAVVRRRGALLSPFPSETADERHRRLLQSADRLRKALSDDDWRVLDDARVRDIR